jgi:hypothetical protein
VGKDSDLGERTVLQGEEGLDRRKETSQDSYISIHPTLSLLNQQDMTFLPQTRSQCLSSVFHHCCLLESAGILPGPGGGASSSTQGLPLVLRLQIASPRAAPYCGRVCVCVCVCAFRHKGNHESRHFKLNRFPTTPRPFGFAVVAAAVSCT